MQGLALLAYGLSLVYGKTKGQKDYKRLLFYMYVGGVLTVTLLPLAFYSSKLMVDTRLTSINLRPFSQQIHRFENWGYMHHLSYKGMVINLMLLMPWAVFDVVMQSKSFKWYIPLIKGFLISLTIESIQLILAVIGQGNRIFDVDDLILNCLGYSLAYWLTSLLVRSWQTRRDRLSHKREDLYND